MHHLCNGHCVGDGDNRLPLKPALGLRRTLQRSEAAVLLLTSSGVASSLHQPLPQDALTAELFPLRELVTRLPGLQQPSDDSWLVLAQGNRGDPNPGKGDASLAGGEGELVLKQAVGASPAPPEDRLVRQWLLGGNFQHALVHFASAGFLTSLFTPKSFKSLWNPQFYQASEQAVLGMPSLAGDLTCRWTPVCNSNIAFPG